MEDDKYLKKIMASIMFSIAIFVVAFIWSVNGGIVYPIIFAGIISLIVLSCSIADYTHILQVRHTKIRQNNEMPDYVKWKTTK